MKIIDVRYYLNNNRDGSTQVLSLLRDASKRENAHCHRYRVHNPQHNCISSLIGNIENRFLSLAVNQQLDGSGAYLFTADNFRKSRTPYVYIQPRRTSVKFSRMDGIVDLESAAKSTNRTLVCILHTVIKAADLKRNQRRNEDDSQRQM